MTVMHQLILHRHTLAPANEWSPPGSGWTIVRVEEGSGYCLQNKNAWVLNSGDGFIAASNSAALVRASQLGFMRLQFFWIQPALLKVLLTVAEWLRLERLQHEAACICCFKADDLTGKKFASIVHHAGNESLWFRCLLLHLWANGVAGLLADSTLAAEMDRLGPLTRFRQLVGQMTEIDLFRYSASDLAGQLQCSQRHFRRLFRHEFGMPFRSHQIELRLQHASQLLLDSDKTIPAVASESGYRNPGLFGNMFKKRFGVTPTEWRRQHSILTFHPSSRPSPQTESETRQAWHRASKGKPNRPPGHDLPQ